MKEDLSLVAKSLTDLLKFQFTGDVLAKGANESLEQWVARLRQAAIAVGSMAEETKKAAPKVDTLKESFEELMKRLVRVPDTANKAAANLASAESWRLMADGVGHASASIEVLYSRIETLQAVLAAGGVAPRFMEQGAGETLQEYANRLQNLVNVSREHKEGMERVLAVNKQLDDDWKRLVAKAQELEDAIKKIRTEEFTKRLKEMQVTMADIAKVMKDSEQISRFGPDLADVTPMRKEMEALRDRIVATLDELYKSRGDIPAANDIQALTQLTSGMGEQFKTTAALELAMFGDLRAVLGGLKGDFDEAGRASKQ